MPIQQDQYPALPVELCELIIDELARGTDTMDHIKACALASRTFLNCSRKHIFRTIKVLPRDIDSDEEASTLAQVHATMCFTVGLFVTNPDLAQYVRNFHIFVLPTHHDYRLFANTLRTLTNVEKLSLESRHNSISCVYWNEINTEVRMSLENIITSPSLVELSINSIHGFPHFLIASARSLCHLSLYHTKFSTEVPHEAQIPPTLYLKSLSFGKSAIGVRTLLLSQSSIINFAHLKHLALPISCTTDFRAATEVLELAVSIESLALVGKNHLNLMFECCLY